MKETIIAAITEGLKVSVLNFLKWILTGIVAGSYWICLTACLIALFLYIAGLKKAGKYISVSFVIYVILQAIKGAIL